MALSDYLKKYEKFYAYRLKSLVPLDDIRMSEVERAIQKYRPVKFEKVVKTPLQSQPMDFADAQNREVYILDFTTELPASAYVLQQDIRQHMDVPEETIRCRATDEPTELEGERIEAIRDMDAEALKMGMRPASLLDQEHYEEAGKHNFTDYYGDNYNSRLLGMLHDVQKSRENEKVQAKNPLFRWIEMPDADKQEPGIPTNDFNDKIMNAPKAASDPKFVASPGPVVHTISTLGNIDDDGRTYSRTYTNGKKTVTLSRTTASMRKSL